MTPGATRILHTLAPGPAGGLESVVQSLAVGQQRRGHAVRVLAIVEEAGDHPFAAPLRAAGVDVVTRALPARAYLQAWGAVARELDDFRPEVVHSHGYRSDLLDAEVARRRRIPTVTTLHGSSFLGGATRLWERLQILNLRRFRAVISVSRPLTAELLAAGVPRDRIHTIPNAWSGREPAMRRGDARRVLGVNPPSGVPLIGFVGRLIPVKNPGLLVESLARIADLPWEAVVVGDGPERAGLEEAAREAGVAPRIRFAGAAARAADLQPAFDLFVLSSRSEGTPMVLFEAMAAGVPVVATSVGGVPDLVGTDRGWLTPPGDPGAMADVLRAALTDRQEAEARAGRARAQLSGEYSTERWLERHDEVYARVTAGLL